MFAIIQNIDCYLFHLFNSTLINPLFDKLMPLITQQQNWNITYILLIILLLWKGGKNGRILFAMILITIIISDQLSSNLIKSFVARPRPCHTLLKVRLLIDCGPGYSFPSSHAVNNFALAVILAYFYSGYRYLFYAIAFLIAYSRVYVGVHYPIDVISGALIGIIIANILLFIYRIIAEKYKYFQLTVPQGDR